MIRRPIVALLPLVIFANIALSDVIITHRFFYEFDPIGDAVNNTMTFDMPLYNGPEEDILGVGMGISENIEGTYTLAEDRDEPLDVKLRSISQMHTGMAHYEGMASNIYSRFQSVMFAGDEVVIDEDAEITGIAGWTRWVSGIRYAPFVGEGTFEVTVTNFGGWEDTADGAFASHTTSRVYGSIFITYRVVPAPPTLLVCAGPMLMLARRRR